MFPYAVSIAILSQITKSKPDRLRRMYAEIIENDSVPLTEIPFNQMETYIREFLLRDSYVDIDLMQCSSSADDLPYISSGVRAFYKRTEVIREIRDIQNTYAFDRTVTLTTPQAGFHFEKCPHSKSGPGGSISLCCK